MTNIEFYIVTLISVLHAAASFGKWEIIEWLVSTLGLYLLRLLREELYKMLHALPDLIWL